MLLRFLATAELAPLPPQEGSDDGVDWEDAGDGVPDDGPAIPDAAVGDAGVSGPLDIEFDELQGAMDKQVCVVRVSQHECDQRSQSFWPAAWKRA